MAKRFVHTQDDRIRIGNADMSLDEFKILEPDYVKPAGALLVIYEPGKLFQQRFKKRTDSLAPTWEAGDYYLSREFDYIMFLNHR